DHQDLHLFPYTTLFRSGHYPAGQKVAAVMGGMGRQYNGGYAEYAVLPLERLMPLQTTLSWEMLGAIPEMFLTAWSSLTESLDIRSEEHTSELQSPCNLV